MTAFWVGWFVGALTGGVAVLCALGLFGALFPDVRLCW